jgi:hypothetical protein
MSKLLKKHKNEPGKPKNTDPESQKIQIWKASKSRIRAYPGRYSAVNLSYWYKTTCISLYILWHPRFADLHGCLELVSSTDSYIERHFTEVLECDEFYSLGADQAGFRLRNLFPGFCSGVFRTWSGSEMDASFNNCRIQPGSGSGRVPVAQLISGVLFWGFPHMIRVWNGCVL